MNNQDKFRIGSGKKLYFTQPLKTSDRDGLKTHAEAVTEHISVEHFDSFPQSKRLKLELHSLQAG